MATSTGSRALDFALGIGAYAPQIEEPELPQEGGIASALPTPHKAGKLSPHAQDFEPIIQRAAQKYNVPPELLRGLIQQESSFNPRAVSSAGAMGLSQLMPGTAAQYGVKDAYDPEQNVMGGAHYLSDMMRRYNNDPQLALAAYNAGPGNVDKYLKRGVPLPSETQNYVPAVMGNVGQQMPAVPASQPVAEGMRVVTLTNGRELEVPAEMTDEQVLEQIRKSPSPEMSRLMPAREATIGGKSALVPFNMQDDEAMHHLVNQGDIPDPMAGKGGRGWGNLVSGFETSIGNMLTGMGKPEEAQRFYEAAKAGEYKMYESEVEAAKRKGIIPGLYAEAQQNLIYPGMEMLGQFAPAMMPGPAALKVGAMYPAARGEILHRAKEEGKEVSEADASLYGLPLAVVETLGLPVKGAGKLLGREAEEAAIKGMVERGAIEEAEKTALGSRAADLARAYGTNVAKNVATMGAMEGIQRGAMGESMLPQSMEDVTSLIEPAAWFSLPHGAMEGLGARGAREEALARESAKREPVQAPERRPEVVEPEAIGEPEITPAVRTELQNIGEMYGRHVMESEARGEPPMSPEEFMAQNRPEPQPMVDELAPGDIEAAPSSQIIQPSPFVRKVQERKNAQQEPSAGPIDGGGRAQSEIRQESGGPDEGGQGVESSGQGFKTPEIIRQEVKVPEAEVKTPPVQKLAPLRERDFTPEEVDRIRAMQDEGVGHRDIAKKLKLPYYDYLTKASRVQAGKGDLGGVIKPGTMKEGEYATRDELNRMPEKDQFSYLQLMGNSKAEMGERFKLSEEEVTNKLKEHGLPDTEAELERKMSDERKKYLEAQQEERAKYREEGAAPEGVEFENIPHTAESPFKWEVEGKRLEEGESPIVDIDGRKIVKARINGKSVPFYLSKRGTSGKAAGKWYPFFGYKDGWFNKGNTLEQIHSYYGSEKLKEVAQHLDAKYGDIRKESHPSADWSKAAIESINEGLEPVSYEEAAPGHVEAALKRLGLEDVTPDGKKEEPSKPAKKAPKKKLSIDELEVEQREAEEAEAKKREEAKQREEEEDEEYFKEHEKEDEEGVYELPDFDYTEPDRELDYSKGEAAKEVHTPESLAKHLTDTYGARKPAVNITTREQAGVDANTKAFYDPKTKKVHLVADNLGKNANIHGLLKHEIGVHAQKLGVKDPEFQGILKHMQGMRDKGIQAVREAYTKVPEGTRPERLHEEALGYLVEHHPHLPLVRRFMSWLRRMAHKLTGHAGWLKPEDLSHMAHRVLKKDYGVESRPERRDVQAEKLRSASDDNVKAIRATGITKTEKPLTYRETADEFVKVAKTAYGKRRGEYIDATDPLTQALQKLDRFDKNLGKLRADLIAAEANQSVGLVAHALENGIPVINKSGSMMVVPGANLKNAVEFARKKDKNGEELLAWALRVNIGEHRLKEHAQDIQDLKRYAREILELQGAIKFHDKLGQTKERKLAEKALASKESAYKTIIRERNIDPETMEGREKVVDAEMIALRDKLMKDHPWLKEATQEVYDSMDGLVDFQLQSGMIDKLTADKWKAAPYVPLYKSLADLEKDPNFSKLFPRSAEAISQVKQIKGYKHAVNMLENLHKHYYGMMLPAVFNHVRKESMSQILHLDALSRMNDNPNLSYEKALRKATEAVETKHSGPNTMKVLDNGEERHYKIQDPDLLQMFAFNRPEIRGFFELARPFTAVQRTAFLKNPAFWGTQLFLDPLYANLTAGAKSLIHPGQALVNLVKIWSGKSEGAKALERHGVDIGFQAYAGKKSLSFERTGEATQFHELFGKRSAFRKFMNMVDRVHNSVDEATRVSVYNAVKKDGKKMGLTGQELEDYAVHRARTYMNFAARGRSQLLNEYRSVTAFSSAAINGADALMKNYKGYGLNEKEGAEVRRIFRNRLMAGVAMGMGLSLAQLNASNDKQEGDLFDQLTSIDTGIGFKLPFKWDVGALIYGLPKIFVMTTLLDSTNPNSLTANQGLKAALELIRKNMLPPLHPPDAINPLVEALTGYSFDDLEPLESAGAMRYSADARGRSNTFLGEFFGNLFGTSGKVADHVGRSYLGKFYDYTNAIADSITGRMEGMPGSGKALEKAIIGPFYKDEDKVTGADRIYDAAEKADRELATFNKFRDSNKEKFAEFKDDPERMTYRRAAPALRNARERLSAYEKQISQIMDSKIPAAAKETRIRQINEQKRKAIEQGNATVKRLLGDYAP